MMPTAARRAVALAVVSFAALVVVAAPAAASPALPPRPGAPLREATQRPVRRAQRRWQPGTVLRRGDPERVEQEGGRLYAAALQAHPQCGEDFETLVSQLSAVGRSQTAIKGTPFLGPIGWLWNTVYYRVFSGNDVMMGLFGWALLLSPIILVFSIVWVMKGVEARCTSPMSPSTCAPTCSALLLATRASGARPLRADPLAGELR